MEADLQWLDAIQRELRDKSVVLLEYNDMIIMLPNLNSEPDFTRAYEILGKYLEKFDTSDDTDAIEAYMVTRAIKTSHFQVILNRGIEYTERRCSLRIPIIGEEEQALLCGALRDYLTKLGFKVTRVVSERYQWTHMHMYLHAELETAMFDHDCVA